MSVLKIGEIVYFDGTTGEINDVEFDDNGQPMGFTLRNGEQMYRYNLDMVMDDVAFGVMN